MPDKKRPRAYDDWWWESSLMSGSAHSVSDHTPEKLPSILVPDGHGDYREHIVVPPKRPLGFR